MMSMYLEQNDVYIDTTRAMVTDHSETRRPEATEEASTSTAKGSDYF